MECRASYTTEVEEVMRCKEGKIRVLLVDSDPVWQQRMGALIDAEPDMNIFHIATNKESAIKARMQLDLDVMILDLAAHSSHLDGLDTIPKIVKIKPLSIRVRWCEGKNTLLF